jgi:hypothetical protein
MPAFQTPDTSVLPQALQDHVADLVQPLKDERDDWKATAEAYKSAFQEQTSRLREAISLCISTRIELEETRARCPPSRRRATIEANAMHAAHISRASAGTRSSHTLMGDQPQFEWQSSPITKANFGHVEQLAGGDDFTKARDEIDRILPSKLSNEARIEGLLLKSAICCASGSDWVLEALAQCSEALTLCDNMEDLAFLLPKIQYHRGLCLLRLRELEQARDAFTDVDPNDPLHDRAKLYRQSCNDQLEDADLAKRRSAFEEHRTFAQGYLSTLNDSEQRVCSGTLCS